MAYDPLDRRLKVAVHDDKDNFAIVKSLKAEGGGSDGDVDASWEANTEQIRDATIYGIHVLNKDTFVVGVEPDPKANSSPQTELKALVKKLKSTGVEYSADDFAPPQKFDAVAFDVVALKNLIYVVGAEAVPQEKDNAFLSAFEAVVKDRKEVFAYTPRGGPEDDAVFGVAASSTGDFAALVGFAEDKVALLTVVDSFGKKSWERKTHTDIDLVAVTPPESDIKKVTVKAHDENETLSVGLVLGAPPANRFTYQIFFDTEGRVGIGCENLATHSARYNSDKEQSTGIGEWEGTDTKMLRVEIPYAEFEKLANTGDEVEVKIWTRVLENKAPGKKGENKSHHEFAPNLDTLNGCTGAPTGVDETIQVMMTKK